MLRERRQSRRTPLAAAIMAALAVALVTPLLTLAGAAGAAGTCPNEAVRSQQRATYLPECRAYELVSPPGALIDPASSMSGQAAIDGGAVVWSSYYPPESEAGAAGGMYFLSRRGANGWQTEATVPSQSPGSSFVLRCPPWMFYAGALDVGVLSDGWESFRRAGESLASCPHNEPRLVSEPSGWQSEPEGVQNLFLRDGATGAFRLINRTEAGTVPGNAYFEAGSTERGEEFSHVVFEERARLTRGAPEGEDLYEYAGGVVRFVSVLPDGSAVPGQLANGVEVSSKAEDPTAEWELDSASGLSAGQFTHAVSRDGERVLFTYEGRLYMRLNAMAPQSALSGENCLEPAKACTVQVDASAVASGSGGKGTFLWANAEGTRVFFSDTPVAQLTANTQSTSGTNLYEFSLPRGVSKSTLVDLTPYAHAEVEGISGISEDGTVVYFAADAALPGTAAPQMGNCGEPFADVEAHETHLCNLYAYASGHVGYVARVEAQRGAIHKDWGGDNKELTSLTARVSANGQYVVFEDRNGLPNPEIWRYHLGAPEGPVCVSCTPGGGASVPTAVLPPQQAGNDEGPAYLNRYVLNSGDVFFATEAPLVLAASNGASNVYEYAEGAPHLISSGASAQDSYYVDVSEGGEAGEGTDVFFLTAQSLLRADPGTGLKLYDARAGGGFYEPPASSECGEADCRSPSGGVTALAPSSSVFGGPGNLIVSPRATKRKIAKRPVKRTKLLRALTACKRLYRHNAQRRKACERRARRRFGAKVKRARRRGRQRHSRQRPRPRARRGTR